MNICKENTGINCEEEYVRIYSSHLCVYSLMIDVGDESALN